MNAADAGTPTFGGDGMWPLRMSLSDRRALKPNPTDPAKICEAFRVVLTYTLSEAFGLIVEESYWAGWKIGEFLAPRSTQGPIMLPLQVRQELLDSTFSAALELSETADRSAIAIPSDEMPRLHADLADWAAVLAETVTSCYQLRPIDESAFYGQMTGLLRELGVGDESNPRPARYLPNAVRERLTRTPLT